MCRRLCDRFRYGECPVVAGSKFFILDERGLITKARSNLKELEENFYDLSTFAEDDTSMEGMKLLDVINKVKPNFLIGLSGCGGIFTGKLSNVVPSIKCVFNCVKCVEFFFKIFELF